MRPIRILVTSPTGKEILISAEQAPRSTLWLHGPIRLWNTITRSSSIWVTVSSDDQHIPLLREQWKSERSALARVAELRDDAERDLLRPSRAIRRLKRL